MRVFKGFLDIIEFFVSSAAVAILIYLFVTQPHQVNGNSMYPNFQTGELLLTDKLSYRFGKPERGDIIIFTAPSTARCPVGFNCDFIKRIIGLPGERIKVQKGKIYINGKVLDEPYQRTLKVTGGGNTVGSYLPEGIERVIPNDSYVAMGDNRPGSSDSRDWGPVQRRLIVGKVLLRYWPPNVAGVLAFGKATLEP